MLAGSDVAPRANDLGRLPLLVAHEVLLVVDPTIGAILAAEAIFDRLPVSLKEGSHFGFDPRKVLGVNPFAPEVRIFEIFAGTIAKQALDIGADKGRSKVALGPEAVDRGGRGIEQPRKLLLGSDFDLGHVLPFLLLVIARRLGQNTLDDVSYASGIGAGRQHFTKRRRCNLGVFSRRSHLDDN